MTCSDAGVLPAMWVDLDQAGLKDAGERVSTEIMHTGDDPQSEYPVPELTGPVQYEDEAMPGGTYTVWNSVAFGHYPQTEIPAESLEKIETAAGGQTEVTLDGTALLMADRCLDSVPYHTEYQDVFWENSDLRKWLNETEQTAGIGFWLLRTNGYTEDNIVYVGEKGYLYNRGIPVTCNDAGIVPAMRIRLGAAPVTREEDISACR